MEKSEDGSQILQIAPLHRETFNQFFLVAFVSLAFYFLIFSWMRTAIDSGIDSTYVSVPFFILYATCAAMYARASSLSLRDLGIIRQASKEDISILVMGTLTLLLFATAGKWVLITYIEAWHGHAVFAPIKIDQLADYTTLLLILLYALFVPVQEFVARGVVLGRLLQCLSGRFAAPFAILISACIYSAVHSYMGIFVCLMVFIPGLVWAWMFYKTKSLMVVSISHGICGLYALLILDVL